MRVARQQLLGWRPRWQAGGGTACHLHLFRVLLASWWHGSVAFSLEVGSRCLVLQVTRFGGHWCNSSGCELKLQIKSFKLGAKGLERNYKNTGFALTASFPWWWDSVYLPPTVFLKSMGTLLTWEKVVTYLPEPPDLGNLRDSCKLSQLQLLNQIFRILPLGFESTQGCQKCDRLHRDARWIGELSHQSSDLSCLCYSLQKVVVHACSSTRFEWQKVVDYLANLQTT